LMCLYWRRTNLAGAIAGMVTGALTVLVWHSFIKPLGGIFGVYELLPAFILALAAIVVVSLLTKEPSKEVTEEFDTYMELEV
ncbi:MAG: sodium:proline symporter, partial [Raoultibacter sp.]